MLVISAETWQHQHIKILRFTRAFTLSTSFYKTRGDPTSSWFNLKILNHAFSWIQHEPKQNDFFSALWKADVTFSGIVMTLKKCILTFLAHTAEDSNVKEKESCPLCRARRRLPRQAWERKWKRKLCGETETETEKERLKVREMDGSGEKIEGIMGQSGQAERGEEAFLWVCVSWHIDRRPSKSRLCALLPQLHLANEKHHYATSTATPLRAKMWEEERGDDFLKGIVLSFWSEIIHEHELVLENTHISHLYQSIYMHMLDCWW